MPEAHCAAGKLCFTMAVVDATTDKNTAPNKTPDNNMAGHAEVKAGMSVATLNNAFKMANAWPPLK